MAVDPVEVYVATLTEVQRQVAQLGGSSSEGGAGAGTGSSAASDSSGWVVLESQSTPAQLPGDSGCSLWPQQQWQIAYEILFCQCPPAIARLRPHEADDMLFFVYTEEAAAAARACLFVRRRQAKQAALPPDLQPAGAGQETSISGSPGSPGSRAAQVDWRASVLLMVVLQTAFRLSVVTAADAELLSAFMDSARAGGLGGQQGSGVGEAVLPGGVRNVTKVVHASPSHVPVNLDHSRSDAGRPQASYPDICFSVDGGDDAFRSQVLRNPADCYCVLLHADVAASWRTPAAQAASSSGSTSDQAGGAAAAAAVGAATDQLAGLALSEAAQQEGVGPEQPPRGRSGSDSAGGSSQGWQSARSDAANESAIVFSGYVSHEQLTAALGSQLAGDPVRQVLRAAAAAARGAGQGEGGQQQALATCRVSMRGPNNRGAADVAVSSYPPADAAGPPGAAEAHAASGSGSSRPRLFQRAQLLAKGMAAAAKQAAVGSQGGLPAGATLEQLHLRCVLMALQVPVDMLADSILQALQQ